ncbi:MAG TPA: glycosyltransferase family 39 protein [Thermodesulfobacteriota bacterium]|nr:glycosyltransferase family 39 protein [Thermodesulfobacteriota bacterium]
MDTFKKHKEVLVILALSVVIVLSSGLTSELYLGDEVCHYRFAKDIFQAGKRVAFDPIYPTGNPPGYFYSSEPFWSSFLAIVWRLTGNISFPLAQIYHTIYYVLLILVTYLLGIEIYGKKEGVYAALLISSIPMVVSFSILFYLDVPGTAFAALSLLLLLKRRYFLTGLAICLMYFTRRNACFLVPGYILVVLFIDRERLHLKLKNIASLILPTGILGFMDIRWRTNHIENVKYKIAGMGEFSSIDAWDYIKSRVTKILFGSGEYLNSSLMKPEDITRYLGLALLISLVLYLFFRRPKGKDLMLWVCIVVYLLLFAFLFGISSDIRYILPIIPLFCLLASSVLGSVEHLKWSKFLIWTLCLVQLLAVSFYVHQRRIMPAGMREGFLFIKENTPKDALFMYPGYIFIEGTGRKFVWGSFFQVESWLMKKQYPELDFTNDKRAFMFWKENEEDIKRMMEFNRLDYIVVDKSRIYDDTEVKHFGGYPKSFIQRLPRMSFITEVFENKEMVVWKVNLERKEGPFPWLKKGNDRLGEYPGARNGRS